MEITIEFCGMSGDGTIAAGGLLNEAVARQGFHVLAFDSYPAEIRGFGKCVTRSTIGESSLNALADHTDILVSLDDKQALSRIEFLKQDALILFDNHPPTLVPEGQAIAGHCGPAMTLLGVPFADLAGQVSGGKRGRNIVALGALAACLRLPQDSFKTAITEKFAAKGKDILAPNIRCFEAGYEFILNRTENKFDMLPVLHAPNASSNLELLSGNVAIGQGALDAGLKLYFGYPITPATPIMEYLAKELPPKGGDVIQMEDEISSIGAVLGSFYAGKRAMTATSGPGFALMTELITHGVMAEIPAVIIDAQRGGPATGLPTKTEQSDLHAAVFGGPGDCPRIVLAPTNVLECYLLTLKAFQLAETYQSPVIILTDFFLDNRVETVRRPSISHRDKADGNIYPSETAKGNYRRYAITESGISPRSIPGMEGYCFAATGLEHSEKGIPNYDPENHMQMSAKRLRKILGALRDLPEPEPYFLDHKVEIGVISWGSTFGTALESVRIARSEGISAAALKVISLYPIHEELIRRFIRKCENILIPELNMQGQLATLISHLGEGRVYRLNEATGVPMRVRTILDRIRLLARSQG